MRQVVALLDAWLDAQRAYDDIPGLSVAVVHDQEVVWRSAYGLADRERGVAATPATVFPICSMSKLFTGMAVLQLRDAGRLRLDDDLGRHLRGASITQAHPGSLPITIGSLLTHSSGLDIDPAIPYWTGEFAFPGREEFLHRLPLEQAAHPAHRQIEYSNLGYAIAGEIVSTVSRSPFEAYVVENIFEPLGMKDTSFATTAPQGLRARGYAAHGRDRSRAAVAPFHARALAPAIGVATTVPDLERFAMWQFRRRAPGDSTVLEADTLREMQRVQFTDPGDSATRGLGFDVWRREGKTFVGHGGDCAGYRSALLMQADERIAVILLTNANGIPAEALAQAIYDLAAPAIRLAADDDTRAAEGNGAPFTALIRFDLQPYASELALFPWEGGVAMLSMPTRTPARDIVALREVASRPLHYRVARGDGLPGEAIRIDVDPAGRPERLWRWNSPFPRSAPAR